MIVPVIVLASIVGYRGGHQVRSVFRTVRVGRADITEQVTATGTLQPVITSFVVTPLWIFVAFGISMAIGVIFGLYPARKAAQMKPIDALRFE